MKYYVLNHYIEEVRSELNKFADDSVNLTEPNVLQLSMKLDRLLVLSQRLKHYHKRRNVEITVRSRPPSRVIRREHPSLKLSAGGS